MSKNIQSFIAVLVVAFTALILRGPAFGQTFEAVVKIDAERPGSVAVAGRFLDGQARKNLSFILEYAGIAGLGERISGVKLFDAAGKELQFKTMMPGEYAAAAEFTSFSYSLDLAPPKQRSSAAHVSWVNASGGILMTADILPAAPTPASAAIRLAAPDGWRVSSSVRRIAGKYLIADTDKGVFSITSSDNSRTLAAGDLTVEIAGEWLFTDDEAVRMITEIAGHYQKLFGPAPAGALIAIRPFPAKAAHGEWEADTRGGTVIILSSDMPFRSQSLQRLHEQLRHELFHLWIPNAVEATGQYDWFYEGFALYASLKAAIGTNRIRFEDLLDAISRAANIDAAAGKLSLIELSERRWAGANTQMYARGLVVAFACDVAMLSKTEGRRSANDLIREVYERLRAVGKAPAAPAVLAALRGRVELAPIVERYITGPNQIDLDAIAEPAGLDVSGSGASARLVPAAKPNGRQKAILDKLGYNNWRKSPPVSK